MDAACLCPLYATIGATYRLETIERLERPNRCAARTLRCAFSSHKKPCRNIPLYRFSSVILTALNLELKPKLQGNNLNPREHIDKIQSQVPVSSVLLVELERDEIESIWS
jgi:hypothetical protein